MLYTTKQIAEMLSGEENNITPYIITHNWIPKGLKHIRGKGTGFLYKKEWVEEFIEQQAEMATATIEQQKGISAFAPQKSKEQIRKYVKNDFVRVT